MDFDTTRKIRITIIAVAIILFVVAGIFAIKKFMSSESDQVQTETAQPAATEELTPSTDVVAAPAPAKPIPAGSVPKDSTDAQLKRTTMDFVARFGTYSTDAENANLKQLLSRMGPQLKAWAEARLVKTPQISAFQGVTTQAISGKIISQTGLNATLEVGVQRTYRDAAGTKTAYEIATVSTVKSGDDWLVNAVTWKEFNPE